ncbi:MAG: S41 family peptidase [Pseudomonadota bacterium]
MKRVMIAAAVGAIAGFGAAAYMEYSSHAQAQVGGGAYQDLELFGDIFERVRSAYVEEVEEDKLVESAINGMLASLDPHSSYLPPKGYDEMRAQTQGEFGGLGIEVTMENGYVKVVAPIDDTPAARAGMQANDLITQLDGENVNGLTLSEAVDRMRGKIGTKITLTVVREGRDEPFEVEIIRDNIKINPVRGRAEDDVAYLRITTFNQQTHSALVETLAEVREEIGEEKLKGYIIDLRNNPGGLLTQAIAVADDFLDKGEIVSTRGRNPRDAERYNAEEGDVTGGKPIVVLVNGGSASASEIVAGALQDHRRGIIVGTKSFGKGSVQTIMPLANRGAIRLTTSRYYTPSGRSIQARGIEPDIVVRQLKVEADENAGGARSESSLRNSLDNEDAGEGSVDDASRERAEAIAKLREEDYQLAYALDLLRGVSKLEALSRVE